MPREIFTTVITLYHIIYRKSLIYKVFAYTRIDEIERANFFEVNLIIFSNLFSNLLLYHHDHEDNVCSCSHTSQQKYWNIHFYIAHSWQPKEAGTTNITLILLSKLWECKKNWKLSTHLTEWNQSKYVID